MIYKKTYLLKQFEVKNVLLNWWYSWTTLPVPDIFSSFHQLETIRRGRLASLIVLINIVLVGGGLTTPTLPIILVIGSVMLVDILTLLIFNRRGKIFTTGIILTITKQIGILIANLSFTISYHGIDTLQLFILMLFIQTELVAVSLLPPKSVFLMFLINTTITIMLLIFLPHTPHLQMVIDSWGWGTLVGTSITILLSVAIIPYVWIISANRAIRRAEAAETDASIAEHLLAKVSQSNNDFKQRVNTIHTYIQNINAHPSIPLSLSEKVTDWEKSVIIELERLRQKL